MDSTPDLDRLSVGRTFKRHDHQQINIGVPLRLAVRVRAEENDLLRMKLARDLILQLLNLLESSRSQRLLRWNRFHCV